MKLAFLSFFVALSNFAACGPNSKKFNLVEEGRLFVGVGQTFRDYSTYAPLGIFLSKTDQQHDALVLTVKDEKIIDAVALMKTAIPGELIDQSMFDAIRNGRVTFDHEKPTNRWIIKVNGQCLRNYYGLETVSCDSERILYATFLK